MKQKRFPTVAKYTQYEFTADARMISQVDYYVRRDKAVAAVRVDVRFPVRDNASTAKLLRDVAEQIEAGKARR